MSLIIVWRITESCDLGCGFCGYSRHLRRARATVSAETVLAFGRLVADYAAEHSRKVLISWLGGEPLLWPPLAEVSRTLNDWGLKLSLTTNGTRLDCAETRALLTTHYAEVTISVDAPDARHAVLRSAPGLFERLRLNVTALCTLRSKTHSPLRVRVNTVLMRDTIGDFERLCETIAGWGVDEISFNALGGRDRPEFFPANHLLPEQIQQFARQLPDWQTRLAQHGLRVLGSSRYLDHLAHTANNIPMPIADCGPGQTFWFIDEQGTLAPCHFTTAGYGVPITELRSTADLHQLPVLFATRQRNMRLSVCDDCPSTQVFGKFCNW